MQEVIRLDYTGRPSAKGLQGFTMVTFSQIVWLISLWLVHATANPKPQACNDKACYFVARGIQIPLADSCTLADCRFRHPL
eukprot:1158269-Pelagomonas_calceolata.AAC.28